MGVKYTAAQVYDATESPSMYFWKPLNEPFRMTIDGEDVEARIVYRDDSDDECTARVNFVIQVGEQYFRKWGKYVSHYGYDWDYGQVEEVFPQTKVITGFYPAGE